MSEHLPECLVPDFDKGLWICICNQLRACEKRMLATLKQIQNDVESELDNSGYDMFKEFKKEVFVRVRDAL